MTRRALEAEAEQRVWPLCEKAWQGTTIRTGERHSVRNLAWGCECGGVGAEPP